MPVYDCGDPDCEPCQRAFSGGDRRAAIARYLGREQYYATIPQPKADPMTTDFEEPEDIVVRIDRTWKSLNTDEIRLLLLEARSEIKSLRRRLEITQRLHDEAIQEVRRLQKTRR